MKTVRKGIAIILLIVLLFSLSCIKEYSYEGDRNNKPPLAIAGPDTLITLPKDSVWLDCSKSSDPDGKITAWQWTKVSGPVSLTIVSPNTATTTVKDLEAGAYQFELKVTDDKGASAKDTVMITVDSVATGNHPTVACAGSDQTITLATNTVTLDGTCSTDPGNNITNYSWTKITGPSSFNMANANVVTTQVSNLTVGVYQFELKVTDASGLFSKDTVEVTVDSSNAMSIGCSNSDRPAINTQLTPIGTLSQARAVTAVASAGNKILFAGGYGSGGAGTSSRVDIYDISTNKWSIAELTKRPQGKVIAVAAGNKIFFAGGRDQVGFQDIDIYDVTTNTWSHSYFLTIYGDELAAAAVGNKVLFTGGNHGIYPSSSVDIYDLTSNTWSTAYLSSPTNNATAVSANNKVYFTGGDAWTQRISNVIDIYDNATGGWSTSHMQVPRLGPVTISVNGVLYFAGGAISTDGQLTCSVETWNLNTGVRTVMYLSSPGTTEAVAQNNEILFFSESDRFDIYDIATNTWSIGVLPVPLRGAAIISVNNTIYVAGGLINGVYNNKVWKLEF